MLWDIVLSREKGRVIPGWQWGRLRPHRGRLIVEDKYITILKRMAPIARLLPVPSNGTCPPELWDCKLLRLNNDYFVFSGYERIDGDTAYAQTWVVKPADESKPVESSGGTTWI